MRQFPASEKKKFNRTRFSRYFEMPTILANLPQLSGLCDLRSFLSRFFASPPILLPNMWLPAAFSINASLFRFALAFKCIILSLQGIGQITSFGISWRYVPFSHSGHSLSSHFCIFRPLDSCTSCSPPLGHILLFHYPASVCRDSAPCGRESPPNSLIAMRMVLIAFAFAN
jgi:hypothetical protein